MSTRVLIVDDTRMYLDRFSELLQSCFPLVQIVTASDATTALRLTQETRFDLIILDYQLQTMTGSDVVRHLRRRVEAGGGPLPPIVMMSSLPDIAVFSRALGVTAFLNKPAFAEDLKAVIGPLIGPPGKQTGKTGQLLWRVGTRPR